MASPDEAQSTIKDETSDKSDDPNNDDMSSSHSDSAHDSMFCSISYTQSPPIQIMERPEDFDFDNRCSSSSSEWSSVSSESLFSIHMSNSDQANISDEVTNSGSLSGGGESDVEKLDEPQKVVRWKTEVERPVEEGVPPQGHQWAPSPLNNHVSSEFDNQDTAKPQKKKSFWSWCNCGSCKCKMPKWSCWKSCWKSMSCSNCKPKKVSSSHSAEANAASSGGAQKKPDTKKGWCCEPSFYCFQSSSCPCHCCCEPLLMAL